MKIAKSDNLPIAATTTLRSDGSSADVDLTPDKRPLFERMWGTLLRGELQFVREELVQLACEPLVKNYFINDFKNLGVKSELRAYILDEFEQSLENLRSSHSKSILGRWVSGSQRGQIEVL